MHQTAAAPLRILHQKATNLLLQQNCHHMNLQTKINTGCTFSNCSNQILSTAPRPLLLQDRANKSSSTKFLLCTSIHRFKQHNTSHASTPHTLLCSQIQCQSNHINMPIVWSFTNLIWDKNLQKSLVSHFRKHLVCILNSSLLNCNKHNPLL